MLKLIRFVIGLIILGFIIYNHQKIMDQINIAMEDSADYSYEHNNHEDDSNYAYDDYDTDYDWE